KTIGVDDEAQSASITLALGARIISVIIDRDRQAVGVVDLNVFEIAGVSKGVVRAIIRILGGADGDKFAADLPAEDDVIEPAQIGAGKDVVIFPFFDGAVVRGSADNVVDGAIDIARDGGDVAGRVGEGGQLAGGGG